MLSSDFNTMTQTSLEALAAEILYHIFKYLDAYSIFFSIRQVCRRFYQITAGYNQYKLNVDRMTRLDLEKFLRRIKPENIISLILSGDYISSYDISRLTRLRSITLGGEKNSNNYESLNQLPLSNLISLRIHSDGYQRNNASAFISRVITQSAFNHLDLIESNYTISQISWTGPSNTRYVTIKACSLTEYQLLLQRLPQLQTFKTLQFIMDQSMITSCTSPSYRQLNSLSIGDSTLSMTDFQQILSLTPSLSTLRLVSHRSNNFDSLLNATDWTHLIQTKLSNLKTFHFFFSYNLREANEAKDLDLIVDQFRTLFWLQEKKWIVKCDYFIKARIIHFYTAPRNTWDFGQPASSRIQLTKPPLTIRFDCPWMDDTFHPIVGMVRITNDIIQTPVYRTTVF